MTAWAIWVKSILAAIKASLDAQAEGTLSAVKEITVSSGQQAMAVSFPRIDILPPGDMIEDVDSEERNHRLTIPILLRHSDFNIPTDDIIDVIGAIYDIIQAERSGQLGVKVLDIYVRNINTKVDYAPRKTIISSTINVIAIKKET